VLSAAWIGAIQGGISGAQIGATFGPGGAFVGDILGSIGGGIIGAQAGKWAVDNVTVGDDSHNGFTINGVLIPYNVLGKR
jgi:hypothetical protein